MDMNQAGRIVAVIDKRIEKHTKSEAQVETTWGEVAGISADGKYASAYLYGSSYESEGFRIPGDMSLSLGDHVKVAWDSRGDRWVYDVALASDFKKVAINPNTGEIATGDGTVEPTPLDEQFSDIGHLHTGVYSLFSHNHAGVYAVADHTHTKFTHQSETQTSVTVAGGGSETTLHTATLIGLMAGKYLVVAKGWQRAGTSGHFLLKVDGSTVASLPGHDAQGGRTITYILDHEGGTATFDIRILPEATTMTYGVSGDTRFATKLLVVQL